MHVECAMRGVWAPEGVQAGGVGPGPFRSTHLQNIRKGIEWSGLAKSLLPRPLLGPSMFGRTSASCSLSFKL